MRTGHSVKLTYDDFLLFPDDGQRHELIDISKERREVLTTQNVRGAPDLVIEVGSPGTRRRDETIKRRLFERSGVPEYWIVDPDLDVVRRYRREGDVYGRPVELSLEAGDVVTTPLLPGLELTLAEIFSAAC